MGYMGGYYVDNRYAYEEVSAYSVSTFSTDIPSGASIVRGIYYMWDENGFSGQGWMQNIPGSPTNIYPGFDSNDDVEEYVADNGNLDDVFSHWAQHYTLEGWDNFYNAVGVGSGCMDVDHSQA